MIKYNEDRIFRSVNPEKEIMREAGTNSGKKFVSFFDVQEQSVKNSMN
ncbi:hypothetical protein LJC52_05140 [Bacteroidales bacterium OttesenSCG-928-A17]|nr:hypothetical protein [Bacteroidales bacterium OttesenSCG-928-A17]